MGHLQQVRYHFHGPHRPVSNRFDKDPQVVPEYQTCMPDRAVAHHILCIVSHQSTSPLNLAFAPSPNVTQYNKLSSVKIYLQVGVFIGSGLYGSTEPKKFGLIGSFF